VTQGIDLFALNNLDLILEINHRVLCGDDPQVRREYAGHIAETQAHFYNNDIGGIGPLFEWYQKHSDETVWKCAAGTYVRTLSNPQLFKEGNHRSGTLIASYITMREGLPPFVLTVDNAEAYFNPSSVIKHTVKRGLSELFKLPKIKKRYAAFLKEQSNQNFLLATEQQGRFS
jgi:hypothetical protein